MKLSKDTMVILKNFSTINSNLVIKGGNKISTISAGKNILAESVLPDSFPSPFGVYDLNDFLGVMSLFSEPELDFSEKYVDIKEGRQKIRFYSADIEILTPPPTIKALPASDIRFEMSEKLLNQIHKVSSILKTADVSFDSDGSEIVLRIGDKNNSTSNNFTTVIGASDQVFSVKLKAENFKMIPADYTVQICAKKVAQFVSGDLKYLVAIELDSSFG